MSQIKIKTKTKNPGYQPRKKVLVPVNTNEPIEFIALDWYECDLYSDHQIERKNTYLNQEHNKAYTIFVFGVTAQGHSVCLRIKNYLPYFYVKIPDNFTPVQSLEFLDNMDVTRFCEDYDDEDIEDYQTAFSNKDHDTTQRFKFNSRYYKDAIDRKQSSLVDKKIFWSFMNEQLFSFAKVAFKSKSGYQFMERCFKSPLKLNISGHTKSLQYNLFESDLEPVLRFMHDNKIKPSSWLQIAGGSYSIENRQAKTQINISADYHCIFPLERVEIPPILIASFDIEADSSHGDFPIPLKDCKKLANQLAITWIRDQRIIEKKNYERLLSGIVRDRDHCHDQANMLPLALHYTDKKNTKYDEEILIQIKTVLDSAVHGIPGIDANAQQSTPVLTPHILPTPQQYTSKAITYLREVAKYITAKLNIAKHHAFFDIRIKKALAFSEYADVDNDVDYIYLKKPTRAMAFLSSPDYSRMIENFHYICNRPIRKIKANTIMKKAQAEVATLESKKLALNPRFTLDDLLAIIVDCAKKHGVSERDLQDKIITKETMARFINQQLNHAFGFANGDTVIQIGTVFWRYGDPNIIHNNIITLKSCDNFKVGTAQCEVISKENERDVLLEWSKLIEEHDPDIIIGYNIFGFDESFMYDRITDLCLTNDRLTLSKDDIKSLDDNATYKSFINLGRFEPSIVKRVPTAKGGIINKKLSSSALGDNFLYYFNMPGRVQIDLLKVCQASLTKLPSYKLDSVSEYYISGKIKEVIISSVLDTSTAPDTTPDTTPDTQQATAQSEEASCILKVDNINDLEVGNYIVISMSTTTAKLYDGDKLKILAIDKVASKITLDRVVPKSCLASVPLWGMGKDDITPQDIFRMQKGTSKDRALIAKYCIQDCALLIRLLRKLEVISNNFGMSNVCLVPFAYIFLRGQGIKAFSLITNECAKENFLLPVLEKIEPEEIDVDDSVRRVHTIVAGGTNGDNEVETDDDLDLSQVIDNADTDEDKEENTSDITDMNDTTDTTNTKDNSTDDIELDLDSKGKVKPFTLKPNFNQIIMNDEGYEGAIVLEPKPDIYTEDPITVMDFSSLYPSEMITSDLSHDRICEDPYWLGESGAKHLEELGLSYLDRSYDNYEWINPKIRSKGKRKCGTTTVRFVQYPDGTKGLIPRILMGLLKSRKTTKKLMESEPDPFKKGVYDGLQLAYKITANSLYGQTGARTSKIYKAQIAAATTAGGRARIIHARDFALREYTESKIIYGDTDSIFVQFKVVNENEKNKISDREKIQRAITIGQEFEEKIKKELPGVHCLAYEKVLFPFILISKKRYLALKYEDSPDTYKQISMGLVLKRRDNAPILKHCYLGVIDCLVKDRNVTNAITFIQEEIKKMIDSKFDMNMFVISKTLSSYYKDPESIAHKVLADRMSERDPGNKPASNERIQYVFIKIKEEKGVEYLQGDRIEHINYVRKHNLQVDYEKYILNQIMKPISQLFELIVEKLPMFPYGKGYYEELHNIYYNKLNGDIDKTDTKIKKLKQAMVQKLIFQPLIDYAHLKVSNVKTLNSWFSQIDNPIKNTIENPNTNIEVKEEKKVEKPKHEIKVKKNKQLNLDSFF